MTFLHNREGGADDVDMGSFWGGGQGERRALLWGWSWVSSGGRDGRRDGGRDGGVEGKSKLRGHDTGEEGDLRGR